MPAVVALAACEAVEDADAVAVGEMDGVMAADGDTLGLAAGDGVELGQLPSSTSVL